MCGGRIHRIDNRDTVSGVNTCNECARKFWEGFAGRLEGVQDGARVRFLVVTIGCYVYRIERRRNIIRKRIKRRVECTTSSEMENNGRGFDIRRQV